MSRHSVLEQGVFFFLSKRRKHSLIQNQCLWVVNSLTGIYLARLIEKHKCGCEKPFNSTKVQLLLKQNAYPA